MASEFQYKVFREIYEEEAKRYSDLDSRAKLYLTIATFYLGALVFRYSDLKAFNDVLKIPFLAYILIIAPMLLALLCVIVAVRIRKFEGLFNPEQVLEDLGSTPPKDEDFRDDRIVDLAVATNRNKRQNDRIANYLALASIMIGVAVGSHVLILAIALVR
jgi:hypothetical protein